MARKNAIAIVAILMLGLAAVCVDLLVEIPATEPVPESDRGAEVPAPDESPDTSGEPATSQQQAMSGQPEPQPDTPTDQSTEQETRTSVSSTSDQESSRASINQYHDSLVNGEYSSWEDQRSADEDLRALLVHLIGAGYTMDEIKSSFSDLIRWRTPSTKLWIGHYELPAEKEATGFNSNDEHAFYLEPPVSPEDLRPSISHAQYPVDEGQLHVFQNTTLIYKNNKYYNIARWNVYGVWSDGDATSVAYATASFADGPAGAPGDTGLFFLGLIPIGEGQNAIGSVLGPGGKVRQVEVTLHQPRIEGSELRWEAVAFEEKQRISRWGFDGDNGKLTLYQSISERSPTEIESGVEVRFEYDLHNIPPPESAGQYVILEGERIVGQHSDR